MTSKTLDTYLDLCTQVYDLSKPTPPKDAYDFYLSYVTLALGNLAKPRGHPLESR
ncbi:methyltransferase, ubiE/COQ5 family [Legionella shakespearei DSM 23087]|uniref:Methyltransferase, ubiE/COQ5 family n=1 Tax=Legionella shakespearei DSM 23087 TaxID=1122169 RepID=A0A0W0Z8A0_9GAMM|nr:methyltransferase, ubiE/COQ5 family [Legionella shakespearei DSM 23087]